MKASLVVLAALFVSPAHAFENLIIDSAFQYPVGLTDKAASWGDVPLTSGPSIPVDFGSIRGIGAPAQNQSLFAAPTLVGVANLFVSPNLFASPNPFGGASPSITQTKPPGNSDAQIVTTSPNSPGSPPSAGTQTPSAASNSSASQLLSNGALPPSGPQTALANSHATQSSPVNATQSSSNVSLLSSSSGAQTALSASNSPAPQSLSNGSQLSSSSATPTELAATNSNLAAPQLLTTASPASSGALPFGLGASGGSGASGKALHQHLASFANSSSMTLPLGHGGNDQSGATNLGSSIGGNFSGSTSGGTGQPNGAGHSGGGVVAAVTTFFSNVSESGPSTAHGGSVHGAPGPVAGAGLPVLAIGYGAYWLWRRYRHKSDNASS
jgi:hypothetical protein